MTSLYLSEQQEDQMRNGVFAMGMIMTVSACATEDVGNDDTVMTQQAISGWATGGWGTTTDLVGADTGWSTSNSLCVLSGVHGNLGLGGYWDSKDEVSAASVEWTDTTWRMMAHGGAYTDQVNQRVWANNPVSMNTVCVPYPMIASAEWKSQLAKYGTRPPELIAGLAPNRRCFLQGIYGGDNLFTHAGDFVRVVSKTSADATHPTPGWYLEGNLQSSPYTEQPAYAEAACTDFPSVLEWTAAFGGATYPVANTAPFGGRKMCGLTGVYGAYNVNSWFDGAALTPPSTQTGVWAMTVSTNKYAEADCIQ